MLVAIEDVARPPSADVLLEKIEQLEDDQKDLSRRLHLEIEELRRRVEAVPSRPLEVQNIRFSPGVMVAIVATVLTIATPMLTAIYQLQALSKATDTIDKRQQLQAIEIQELKEMVLKQGVGK